MWKIRIKRLIRSYFTITWHEFCAPLIERSAFLQYILFLGSIYLTFYKKGEIAMLQEISANLSLWKAFLLSLPVYLIFCLLKSFFIVGKKQSLLGIYTNNGFIYHQPYHLKTVQSKANEEFLKVEIIANDAEPNTLVYFQTKAEGSERIFVGYGYPKNLIPMGNFYNKPESKVGLRVPRNKKIALFVKILPSSTPIIIRVYMSSWQI